MLWVLVQRAAVAGGPFAVYLKSLPTSEGRRRAVDAAVVLIASTPLLVPVLAATIALAFLPQQLSNYLYVLDLLLITLGAQLMVLSRDPRNGPVLIVANVILIGGLEADGAWRAALLAMALAVAAFAVARVPAASPRRACRRAFTRGAPGDSRARSGFILPPWVGLQAGIIRHGAAANLGRCVMMGAAAASTCFLYGIWDFDARVVPLTLISQAIIALIAATTFRDLRTAHAHAAAFMRSLPRAGAVQVGADVLTVGILALPFAAVGPMMLAAHGVLSLPRAAALLLSGAPLLAWLRLPQCHLPRQAVLLGAILAALWVAVMWPIFI
ncbi:DUF6136 family protein [Burkholderia anthina]|uniref:DUF6136 family protein n=1 Tax=Burkholderia anthina TaxID=179879 RepID=UPI00158AA3CD